MRKISRVVVREMTTLTNEEMALITGGDKDPNVCHSKTEDSVCSGSCYQYEGGSTGSCYWDYHEHSCKCVVAQ